ncbi:MAG: hypothetical protein HQL12_04735 [Candidatus Omnitrophica bacterium]|nr:hypothetical protein [Candidatus Omnitrophota bacterium]
MKDLLPQQYKRLVWFDECGEEFLLLNYAEVFKYSDEVLRLHIYRPKQGVLLEKETPILNKRATDDGLLIVDIDKAYLTRIIELGAFKRRPDYNGKFIKALESKLAHKILPTCPREEG